MKENDTPAQEDLKATSDSIRHDAHRIARLEETKSQLEPTDPLVDEMSRDIEKLATDIAAKSKMERELAAEDEQPDELDSRPN